MTFVSKIALAAVLTLGTTAIGIAPAHAQKKDEKKDPGLQVSKEFREPAAAAETAVKAKDWAAAEPNIVKAEALAKNDDEKYFAAFLRYQLEAGRGNEAGVVAPLRVLESSPKTPAELRPQYGALLNFLLGKQAADAKKHAETIQYLVKARELGSTQPDVPVMLANAYSATGRNAESLAELSKAIELSKAAGRKPPENWYQFAIPKVNAAGDRAKMAEWLTRFLQEYPTVKNWRWAVQVFNQTTPAGGNERVERMALFRLMRATNSLADRGDYVAYATAAQSAGLPWETVAVIDEGRKSGKIPQADSEATRLYATAQTRVKGEGSLETQAKRAAAASDGKDAVNTADAFLASGDYTRAVALYDLALQKGGVSADEVNLNRGIALHRAGRKEEARAAFQRVGAGPYANLATLWQASLDAPALS